MALNTVHGDSLFLQHLGYFHSSPSKIVDGIGEVGPGTSYGDEGMAKGKT